MPALSGHAHEEIWLLGQPALVDYLEYVREMTIDGMSASKAALVDEWRAANDYYYELERREANIADDIECRELPSEFALMVKEVAADHRFRETFSTVPAEFGLVELDRLVVFQKHITGHFVEKLKSQLRPSPSAEALFRFCMPPAQPDPSLRIRQAGPQCFVFSSDSLDLRWHEPALLKPNQIRDFQSHGAIAGVLGLVAGYSANFLSAIRSDNRLLLHNGNHRAVAMRALGITHAPCIIQTVTRRDELDIIAKRRISDNPEFYFRAVRPPLLKDFLDPRIRKTLPTHKIKRVIEMSFEVREMTVPD